MLYVPRINQRESKRESRAGEVVGGLGKNLIGFRLTCGIWLKLSQLGVFH